MVNYNNSIIYKIVCKDINVKEFYVGSTTNFNRRKQEHKHTCNNPNSKNYNVKLYKLIRETQGWVNWDMVLVEKYDCNDKLELHKQERYWIETLGATLNVKIPYRSKERKKEYNKEYMENNKDKIRKQRNVYGSHKVKCEICNTEMRRDSLYKHNKTKHK
jgi:hypothetical protein